MIEFFCKNMAASNYRDDRKSALRPGSYMYIVTVGDCRINELNRLSIDFTVVNLPVNHNTYCLSSYL